MFEDLAAQGIVKNKAWAMAQTEIRRRRFRLDRREREKVERAKARAKSKASEAKPAKKRRTVPHDPNRKKRERENRREGRCACGKKPRKGLLNCDRCLRRKHPPGMPRRENRVTVSKNQKRHYKRYKRNHKCVDCGKLVRFDEELGRYPSRCLEHRSIDAMNSAARRWGVAKESLAAGKSIRREDDLEDTGDLELEDVLMSTEEDVWEDRNPRRNRDARRGTAKVSFED